eukprot:748788_1
MMDSASPNDIDFVQLSVLIVLVICGAVMTYKSLSTKPKVSDELNIPTFSDETDWNSVESQKKLSDTFEKYGCCYYKMNKSDRELYDAIYPQVLSVFEQTIN